MGSRATEALGQLDRLADRCHGPRHVAAALLESRQDRVRVEPLGLGPGSASRSPTRTGRFLHPGIDQRLAIGPELFGEHALVLGAEQEVDGIEGAIA